MRIQYLQSTEISFIVLLMLVFAGYGVNAQTVYYAPSSVEVREFIAEQLANSRLQSIIEDHAVNNPNVFSQSNGARFLVYYGMPAREKGLMLIRLVPHNDTDIVKNSVLRYGTWDIVLSENYAVQKIVYYFQDDGSYRIVFSPHRTNSRIAVYLEDIEEVAHVTVPMDLMTVLRMKFDDIMQATQVYIMWEDILPLKKNFEVYERARRFALYLRASTRDAGALDVRIGERADKDVQVRRVQQHLFVTVNEMLSYIGEADVENVQFFPTYSNGMRLGVKEPTYLRRYADKVFAFLQTFPEFNAEQLPQRQIVVKARYTMLTRLYRYALANPKRFYIIISGTNAESAEKSKRTVTYDSVQVVVPYFTASGKFGLYAENMSAPLFTYVQDISQEADTESFIPSTTYRRVVFLYHLRVPSNRSYN